MKCDYDWMNKQRKGQMNSTRSAWEFLRNEKTSGLNFRVKVSDVLKDIVKVKAMILMVFVIRYQLNFGRNIICL